MQASIGRSIFRSPLPFLKGYVFQLNNETEPSLHLNAPFDLTLKINIILYNSKNSKPYHSLFDLIGNQKTRENGEGEGIGIGAAGVVVVVGGGGG